jgi:FOG: LysM repeat
MKTACVKKGSFWVVLGGFFLLPGISSAQTHVVQKGETLYSLARNYAVDIDSVLSWNQLEGSALSIGQVLVFEAPDRSDAVTTENVPPIQRVYQP